MAFSLYELSGAYLNLLGLADDEEKKEQFRDTLDSLKDSIEQKCENLAVVIKTIEAETKALEYESKRLESRIQSRKNRVEGLKIYLQENLQKANLKKLSTRYYSLWIQDNPGSLEIQNEASIPATFKISQPDKIDKKSLMQHIKEGNVIEGVTIKQSSGLRIR